MGDGVLHGRSAGGRRENEIIFAANPALTWADLAWLRKQTRLPILLKGLLHPDDARRAVEHGVEGVIVSNHGGRQVDGAVASLDALPAVVAAVEGDNSLVTGNLLANDPNPDDAIVSVKLDAAADNTFTVDGLYGELVVDANGHYTYTLGFTSAEKANLVALGDGHSAQDVFTYTISDGIVSSDANLGGNASGLVTINAGTLDDTTGSYTTTHNFFLNNAAAFSASSRLMRPSPSVSMRRKSSAVPRNSRGETSPSRLRSIL